jgi:hypothetical protein
MKNFTLNIAKMIRRLMPGFLFQPIHYAWLQTILAGISNIYTEFLAFKQQMLYDATIDSTVIRLTRALNDKFDPTNSIYILQNSDYLEEAFIYLESDGASPEYDYLDSEDHEPFDFDYLDSEYNNDYNFIVRIPVAIAAQSSAVYAFVARYAFSGLTFTVETF